MNMCATDGAFNVDILCSYVNGSLKIYIYTVANVSANNMKNKI